jgi:hypothetical protein
MALIILAHSVYYHLLLYGVSGVYGYYQLWLYGFDGGKGYYLLWLYISSHIGGYYHLWLYLMVVKDTIFYGCMVL